MALSFVFLRYFSMLHWIECQAEVLGTAYLAGSPYFFAFYVVTFLNAFIYN